MKTSLLANQANPTDAYLIDMYKQALGLGLSFANQDNYLTVCKQNSIVFETVQRKETCAYQSHILNVLIDTLMF